MCAVWVFLFLHSATFRFSVARALCRESCLAAILFQGSMSSFLILLLGQEFLLLAELFFLPVPQIAL